ncbi:hypothetical protein [Pseudanabaena sp. FACHB-2040]|uniref:hypothetical protein n=1 Tax=Pseudanabaena sp. FACHB-2040 TaxID=2692859 RepID=UPI0016825583|nr:hypothetical protein [Pseudanabaena sp. FACHB-2040]MBD0267702.1 hypothetical protein [Cyanobacteria bacterium Co-bin8]MBD2260819.1 hypothetical protein [Pseudanabaena sp. FACHB-2040]
MADTRSAKSDRSSNDAHIWQSLKRAIASSSGFQRWKAEHDSAEVESTSLEQLVRRYLRETLETLAY